MITLPSTVRDRGESVTRRLRRLLREVVRLRDELDDVRHDAGTEDDDEVEDGGDEVHPVQNGYPAN